jgi:hypothetical protein
MPKMMHSSECISIYHTIYCYSLVYSLLKPYSRTFISAMKNFTYWTLRSLPDRAYSAYAFIRSSTVSYITSLTVPPAIWSCRISNICLYADTIDTVCGIGQGCSCQMFEFARLASSWLILPLIKPESLLTI